MAPVPRIGRILDLIGLLLFLGGGGLFVRSWLGFRSVQSYQAQPDDPPFAAIQLADGFWRLQKIGVGVMLAGIAVFVTAWWVARRAGEAGTGDAPA